MRYAIVAAMVLLVASGSAPADDGFVSPFNGKDLTGWVNVNCAPETWTVKDGVIACTGKPTGALRMNRMVENFILELEWRHLKVGGNSGVFVWGSPIAAPGVPFLRGIEVQVLDNGYNAKGKNEWYTTHGDIFPIHGATMKPIYKGNGMRCFPLEERSKSSPEWNHYRVEGRDGKIRLAVNGKEVSGGDDCVWRKGYLALESEGSDVEFRNLRLKELPGGTATAAQSAPEDQGWRSLYNGLDLRGWKADDNPKKQWTPSDWQLRCAADAAPLQAEPRFGDCELIVDCQLPRTADGKSSPTVIIGERLRLNLIAKPGAWVRNTITIRGGEATLKGGDQPAVTVPMQGSLPASRTIGLVGPAGSSAAFGNIYVRDLK
ncbi:MAG: DUF1080 domain-containing protein [Gemmataceae bacterium]